MNPSAFDHMRGILEEYAPIPLPQWEKLKACLKPLEIDRNGYFLIQGDEPDRFAFILSGIFRVFCLTESGDEKTLAFRTKGQFLAAFTPFIEKREAWYSIQALTPGTLVYLHFKDYVRLSRAHPCWEKLVKEYILRLFIEKEAREKSFLTENARTRYLGFRRQYPDLEKEIHNFHIASYLGISPVSLSRIRGELKKNPVN